MVCFFSFGATCAESRGRGSAFMRCASYDFHCINSSFLVAVVAGADTRRQRRGGAEPIYSQKLRWELGVEGQAEERCHADHREVRARTPLRDGGLSGAERGVIYPLQHREDSRNKSWSSARL